MSTLLLWREKLQKFYAGYSTYILKALQFVTGFVLFWLINTNIGYMEMASSIVCTAGLAVICTFFPMVVMTLAAAALILVHFYALSMPIAIVSLVIFLLMYIFYFRFTPKKAWIVLLSALAFGLKVPFVLPVVFGLMGTPVWIVPAAFGIIAYYMTDLVKDSAAALRGADAEGMANSLMSFTKQLFTGREMWLMVAAVVIGILLVNLIRTRSVDHAWKIASASGAAACVIIAVVGNIALDANLSYVTLIVSACLGIAAGLVLEFLFFSVDYSRTENIQFEDDEYYYYVKAVPKVGVAVPEKEVKRITGRSHPEGKPGAPAHRAGRKGAAPEAQAQPEAAAKEPAGRHADKNTDEILLTRSLSKELGLDEGPGKTE